MSTMRTQSVNATTLAIEPCGLPPSEIRSLAEKVSEVLGYTPGADLRTLFNAISGRIEIRQDSEDAFDNSVEIPSSIEVHQDGSFVVKLSPWLFPLQERVAIAHELGHFILHSRVGKIPLTAHFTPDAENEQIEFEAQEFAIAFLLPELMLRAAIDEKTGKDALSLAAYFMAPAQLVMTRMKQLAI